MRNLLWGLLVVATAPAQAWTLSWQPVSTLMDGRPIPKAVAYYEVEKSLDGRTWSLVGRGRSRSRTLAVVDPGTCFRVRAVIGGPRVGAWSVPICAAGVP